MFKNCAFTSDYCLGQSLTRIRDRSNLGYPQLCRWSRQTKCLSNKESAASCKQCDFNNILSETIDIIGFFMVFSLYL